MKIYPLFEEGTQEEPEHEYSPQSITICGCGKIQDRGGCTDCLHRAVEGMRTELSHVKRRLIGLSFFVFLLAMLRWFHMWW